MINFKELAIQYENKKRILCKVKSIIHKNSFYIVPMLNEDIQFNNMYEKTILKMLTIKQSKELIIDKHCLNKNSFIKFLNAMNEVNEMNEINKPKFKSIW